MRPAARILLGTIIASGVVAGLLTARRPWIEPIEGVRLEPELPLLAIEDVAPGSPYDLFVRACDMPEDSIYDYFEEAVGGRLGEASLPKAGQLWADRSRRRAIGLLSAVELPERETVPVGIDDSVGRTRTLWVHVDVGAPARD